ncbi:sensor histidine kinase [Brevibacterium album]|uniref:sensor histidine kinase n=1 Tax=Brevibacterium album TaxID=417948 RepID=UPI0004188426|nr:sensor histidine kinase [Brevibacterium album]
MNDESTRPLPQEGAAPGAAAPGETAPADAPTRVMPDGEMPTRVQAAAQPHEAAEAQESSQPQATPVPHPTGDPSPADWDPDSWAPAAAPARYTKARMPWLMGIFNVTVSALVGVFLLWIPTLLFFSGVAGLFALGSGVLALIVWFFVMRAIHHVERLRSEAVYGEHILVPRWRRTLRTGFPGWLHQQWLILASGAFWRSTAHHYVKAVYGAFVGVLVTLAVATGVGVLTLAINPDAGSSFFVMGFTDVPAGILDGFGENVPFAARFWVGALGVLIALVGFAILVFSPWPDRMLDRALLPPAKTEELEEQRATLTREVGQLETARSGAVDAATTERLRIERDLHDGVQPMLVALSMKLGMAKSKLDSDPDGAKRLVGQAHEDSKAAITELRQLARGIHPAVLDDRGLDAAISALAARSSVPVSLDVRVPEGVNREAESVAYFVVAESLTNIAKHAQATSAHVAITGIAAEAGHALQIVVTDNGLGGAKIMRDGVSTGLRGLADRVAAAKGTLSVTSPAGGPTTIVVEVPCAS